MYVQEYSDPTIEGTLTNVLRVNSFDSCLGFGAASVGRERMNYVLFSRPN